MRYLVVANQTLGGASIEAAVTNRAREGARIHVVVPATDPAHDRAALPGGTAEGNANDRLEAALARFRAAGVEATGEVGDADPMKAMRDALATDHYTGLIISTLPAGLSRWLHLDLPHRAVREFELPVEWVEARAGDERPAVVHIEVPSPAQRALDAPNIPKVNTPPKRK